MRKVNIKLNNLDNNFKQIYPSFSITSGLPEKQFVKNFYSQLFS